MTLDSDEGVAGATLEYNLAARVKRYDRFLHKIAGRAKGADDALADVRCWFLGFNSAKPEEKGNNPPGLGKLVEIREIIDIISDMAKEEGILE